MSLKTLWLWLFISAFAFWASACWSAPLLSDRYDSAIKKAAWRFMPGTDWRLYKAQLYQESLLDPSAQSPAGAQGIAQFMPGTWADISRQLGYGGASPFLAQYAIPAGAYYMGSLRRSWSAPRPEADRHSLALASYNAGLGNVLKAQRAAGGANAYADIISSLPQVTGEYSKETITYVERIWKFYVIEVVGK